MKTNWMRPCTQPGTETKGNTSLKAEGDRLIQAPSPPPRYHSTPAIVGSAAPHRSPMPASLSQSPP